MATTEAERITKLVVDGPFKREPAKRRVRGLVGGQWIFDTLEAEFVWEHPYFPMYYIPLRDIQEGPGEVRDKSESKGFWSATLYSGGKSVDMTVFENGALDGLVKLNAKSVEWYAEDEKLLGGHPKDPYKRIECLPSSREIRIEFDGQLVAKSTNNVFLYETMLRTRYYMAPTSIVDWRMLVPSDTSTFCPYKGQASYYHLKVGDHEIKDAVWYYVYPTQESAQIQGRLCFYNEKVDVFIDGKKEQK